YRLVQETRKGEGDSRDWLKTLKGMVCGRHKSCGKTAKSFERKVAGQTQTVSGLLYCGRCDCDGCHKHKQEKLGRWGFRTLLGYGDDLRCEVHVWQGPVGKWSAIRQSLKRAGVRGYLRVLTEGGLVVLADKSFPGSTQTRPYKALNLFLDSLLIML